MPGKRFTAEKIINMLREAEVLLSTGKTAGEVCRELNISEQNLLSMEKRIRWDEGRTSEEAQVVGEGESEA